MNRSYSVVAMHLKDRFSWFFLPWIIMGSSFVVNLGIASTSGDEIRTGGLASIYVYMFVVGLVSVAQTFPLALGFGIRRKDYFAGSALTQIAVSLITALALLLLTAIESGVIDGWGVHLYFFNIPYWSDGNAFANLWTSFGLLLNLFALGFAIACLYRRFRKTGIYAFFIAMIAVCTVGPYLITYYNGWDAIGRFFEDWSPTAAEAVLWLTPLTLLYWLASYLMLRRSTV